MFPSFKVGQPRAAFSVPLFSGMLLVSSLCFLPEAKSAPGTDAFPTIPESQWTGLRLMILPQSRALQHYGYQELYQDPDKNTNQNTNQSAKQEYAPLRYEDYVGRVIRVVGIGRGNLPNGDHLDEADLELEGSGKIIHGDIDQGCMNDVAPVADLENARKLYGGKTLWLSSDHLNTYDPQKDTSDAPSSSALQKAFQKIPIKQFSPVKVVDIVPGWYASAPTRFIVQDESGAGTGSKGAEGYVDVHMSDTNIPPSFKTVSRFRDVFSETDPRTKYPWPSKVWDALENKRVFLGMTAPQVRMSWGAPKEVRAADQNGAERWVYDSGPILTLKNDVLEEISGPPAPAQ